MTRHSVLDKPHAILTFKDHASFIVQWKVHIPRRRRSGQVLDARGGVGSILAAEQMFT